MSLTNAYETVVMNWLFTAGAVTRPTQWYIGLFTSDPTDTGAAGTEVSGGSYARQSAAFSVSADTASNTGLISFPTATANWGTITHAAVFDAVAGTMIASGPLTASKVINSGDQFTFPIGNATLTLD